MAAMFLLELMFYARDLLKCEISSNRILDVRLCPISLSLSHFSFVFLSGPLI